MSDITLGASGITVNRLGFGALPLQRPGMEEAVELLRAAADSGVTFFDTARLYTDSEDKIGAALSERCDRLAIATKTMAERAVVPGSGARTT